MKAKPILIIIAVIFFAACGFFTWRHYQTKPQMNEVVTFLNQFNKDLKEDVPDSLVSYFSPRIQKSKKLIRLLRMLANARDINDENTSAYHVNLITASSEIKMSGDVIDVDVPVEITCKSEVIKTVVKLKIRKTGSGQYAIMELDGKTFVRDYLAYDRKFNKSDQRIDKTVYDPLTLAAFKAAESLKSRYDTVVWFQHINKQTYFFVAKGKWNLRALDSICEGRIKSPWKMGLLNPELKEIIPAEYDLIHNIGATFAGLIEVERGSKRGLYNTEGTAVLPCTYDEILPLNNSDELAVLRNGNDYFYLKKDYSITEKVADFKITDVLPKMKNYGNNYTLSDTTIKNTLEYNSRDMYTSLYFPPSFLVDWQVLPRQIDLQNPLRQLSADDEGDGYGSASYKIEFKGQKKTDNWFEAAYYTIVDDYLGTRGGLYPSKKVLMVDKRQNRVMGLDITSYHSRYREGGPTFSGLCNENYLKQLNDTLFELKTTANYESELPGKGFLHEIPGYYYLHIVNGKIQTLPSERYFSFTQYVKMDDSYLNGCYVVDDKAVDHATLEMLQYAKNEIFAQYSYKFKNPMWTKIFTYRFGRDEDGKNVNVDDSLTIIDKYNINWLDQKIKTLQKRPGVLAAK